MKVKKFHKEESGAIVLVLMAAFLILFMMSLVIFDTGRAAEDKLKAQIAADVSSFSHTVIKSRTMNMMTYANTIKRMFYSYAVTYANGLTSLIAVAAWHTWQCKNWNFDSCWQNVKNILMIGSEAVESIFDLQELGFFTKGRAVVEVESLERYQQYMNDVTPWWAWTENIIRSFDSGALVTASWPPPSGSIENVKSSVSSIAGNIDWLTGAVPIIDGTNLQGALPSHTTAVDALPLARRDRVKDWSTSFGPFDYSKSASVPQAAADYCTSWIGSFEWMLNTAQTYAQSNDFKFFKEVFLFNQFAPLLGCTFVSIAWHIQVKSAYLDWIINTPESNTGNGWLKATSNLTYSYVPRETRTAEDRDRYAFVEQDYANPRGADGYFALSRSELVYKPALGARSGLVDRISGAIGSVPVIGTLANSRLGIQPEPDMWQPRWTARHRPVALPGESFGAASMNQPAGLNSVINDTIPYLVIGAGIVGGLGVTNGSDHFGVQSGIRDLVYLYKSVASWGPDQIHGVAK